MGDRRFVYWLKGVAECGKSAIAQTFAELSAKRERLGASFFCSRDFPDRRNPRLIIPTLARALALRFPEFKTALVQILRSHPGDIAEASLDIQFEKLIVEPLKTTRLSTTIVVDALDECESKEPVSEFLSVLAGHLSDIPNVKFFITGRPEDHVRAGFASLRTRELPLHDVDQSTIDPDIRSFVRAELKAIATRNPRSVAGTWPSEEDIEAITRKASGHFIVASIIVKFIGDRHDMPQKRLDTIIKALNSTIWAGRSGIDKTYGNVLTSSFNDVDENCSRLFEELRTVLACIVLTFHPLSRTTIAGMLGVSPEQIWTILGTLHSVLIVPDSESEPIRICHKSFADFLRDSSRCVDPRFHIHDSVHHLKLGVLCLKFMDTKLENNMCGLPRYILNKDVMDLNALREKYIGSTLAYACGYWAKHLQRSRGASDVVKQVDQFFRNHFLSWLEVLSIEANLGAAVHCLRDVIPWMRLLEKEPLTVKVKRTWLERLSRSRPKTIAIPSLISNLLDLMEDCEIFVSYFFQLMEVSAMHILHSALPWSPTSSLIRRVYEGQMMAEARIVTGVDVTWGPSIKMIPLDYFVQTIVFSHQGTLIAVTGNDRMEIFDTITGAYLATFYADGYTANADFSHDINFLTYGRRDGTVKVVDVLTGHQIQTFRRHRSLVSSVAFSPSGNMVASGSTDATIRIWNVSSGRCECCLKGHSNRIGTVCWSGNGKQVISGSDDRTVRIWDVSTGTCSHIIREHMDTVTSVASFGDLVASAEGGTIRVYDSKSDCVLQTISSHELIFSVRFSTEGDKLLSIHRNSASIWDLAKNMRVWTIPCNGQSAAFSPDGTYVASGGIHSLKICETRNRNSNSKDDSETSVREVRFSPDGQLLASRSMSHVEIWDSNSGKCLAQFKPDSSRDYDFRIEFSPNSEFVALGMGIDHWSSYWEWIVWNIRTHRQINKIKCDTGVVALSSDGARMASVSPVGIDLWAVQTGKRIYNLKLVDARKIRKISFNGDGLAIHATTDGGHTMSWRISPAPLPNPHTSVNNKSASPQILVSMEEARSDPPTSASSEGCIPGKDASGLLTGMEYVCFGFHQTGGMLSRSTSTARRLL